MEKDKKKFTDNSKKMTEIRRVLCENRNNVLAQRLGMSDTQASALCRGTKSYGTKMTERILEAFPEVCRVWFLTGEGPMIAADNGSQVINGDGNHHNTSSSTRSEAGA